MNPFQNFDWSLKSIGKVAGAILLGFVGLSLVAMLISFSIRTVIEPLANNQYRGGYGGSNADSMMMEDASFATNKMGIIPPIPRDEGVDEHAEDFEVRDYSVNYRPTDKVEICDGIAALKTNAEIIFENANESESGCNYTFKVLREREGEILALLKKYDPKDVNINVYTIQRTIQDNESRVDILRQQLTEKEAALNEAQASYTELQVLATRQRDVENLTKLIDLKINTIDRLAQEKISLNQQLDQMASEQARQLERIKYTSFNVSIWEDKILNLREITDSWKQELQRTVSSINDVVQKLTIGLIPVILSVMLAVVYFLIAVIVLRGVWGMAKRIWNWKRD